MRLLIRQKRALIEERLLGLASRAKKCGMAVQSRFHCS
jgi:hypothetical protein